VSDTPRTDAEVARTVRVASMSGLEQAWEDMAHFARELERELAAERCLGKPGRYWYDAFQIAEGLRADAERRVQELKCIND
jgi:hypothetical protein